MSQQVLDQPTGDAGKTYSLASWLPSVRISGGPRPHATVLEDGVTAGLALFTLFALFLDGLRHNNLTGIDTFWSGAHIAMYAGLIGLGVWLAYVLMRYQKSLDVLEYAAVPYGYALAFVALPFAAIAGPADFIWHEAYGFENQIDSTYSPPHQGLFLAGALLGAIGVASAWRRSDVAPALRPYLPAVFSMTSVVAVVVFVVHQLVPAYSSAATTAAFLRDLAGRDDAFAPGSEAVHPEGLSTALTNYGDQAFPYYFYSTHAAVAGFLLFTAALVGGVLVMRRRWRVPFGSLTLMCTTLALLFPMLSEYRQAELIPSLVLGGLIGDVMLARLTGGTGPVRMWRLRLFAALLPIPLWVVYFLCVELFQDGLGWGTTLWFGVLTTSAGVGYLVSLLVFPPASGVVTEQVPPTAQAGA